MKPGLSLARIGVRPMREPTSVVAARASSLESAVATTSTSFISAGGLKKCMPTTRSGPGVSAAIAVTGSEEVLLARIVSGPQASASAANSLRFSSRSSGAASITRSHSPRSSRLGAAPTRPLAASASSSLHRPFVPPFARALRSRSIPVSSAAGTGSWRRVS